MTAREIAEFDKRRVETRRRLARKYLMRSNFVPIEDFARLDSVIDRVREGPSLVLKRKTLAHAVAGEFDARIRSMSSGMRSGRSQ